MHFVVIWITQALYLSKMQNLKSNLKVGRNESTFEVKNLTGV